MLFDFIKSLLDKLFGINTEEKSNRDLNNFIYDEKTDKEEYLDICFNGDLSNEN